MNSAASSNEALILPRKQAIVPNLKRTRCWGNYDTANQIFLRKKCENKGQDSNVDREKDRDVNNKSIDNHKDVRSITKATINIQSDMILAIRQQQNDQKVDSFPPTDDYKIDKARTFNDMLTKIVDKNNNCNIFDLRDYSYRQNGMHDVMQNDDISVENSSVTGSIGYHSLSDNIRDIDIETLSEAKDCGSQQHLADTEHKAVMKILKNILNDIDAPLQKNVRHKENQDTATTHKMTNIEEDKHLKNKGCEEIFPKLILESLKSERVDFEYYFPKSITSEETTTRTQVSSSELIQNTREVLNVQAAEKRKINEENQKRKDNENLEREKKKLEAKKNYLNRHDIKKQTEGFKPTDDKGFLDRNEVSEEAKRKYYDGDVKEAKHFDKDKSGSDKDDLILSEKSESVKKKELEPAAEKEWRAEVKKEEKSEIDEAKRAKEKSIIDKDKRDKYKVTSEGVKLKGKDEVSKEGLNQFTRLEQLNIKKKSEQKELEPKDKHVVDKTEKAKLSEKDKPIPGEQVITGGKGSKSTSPGKDKPYQKIKGEDDKAKTEKIDKSKVSTTKEPETIIKKQQAEFKKNIIESDIDMKGGTGKIQAKPSRNKPEQQTQDLGHKANQSKDGKFSKTEKIDKSKVSTTKEPETIIKKQQAEFKKNIIESDIDMKGDTGKIQAKPSRNKPEQQTQDLGHKANQSNDGKFAKTEKIDKSKVSTTKEPETIIKKQQAEFKKNIIESDIDMKGDTGKIQAKPSRNKPEQQTQDLGHKANQSKDGKFAKTEKIDKSKVSTTKEPETIIKKQQAEFKKNIIESDIDMKGDTGKIQAKPSRNKPEQQTQDLGHKANQSKDGKFEKTEKIDKSKVSTTKEPETIIKKQEAEFKKNIIKSDIDMKGDTVKIQAKPSRNKPEQQTQDLGHKTNQSKDDKFAKTEKIDKSKVSTTKEPETIIEKLQAELKTNIKKSAKPEQTTPDLGDNKQEALESRASKKEKPKKSTEVDIKGIKVTSSLPGTVNLKKADADMKGIKDKTSFPGIVNKASLILKGSDKPIMTEAQRKDEERLNQERAEASRALKEEKERKRYQVDMKSIKLKKSSLPNLAVARIPQNVQKQNMESVSRLYLSDLLLSKLESVKERSISLESDSEIIVHQKLYKSYPKKFAVENEVKPMFFKTNYQKEVESDLSFGPKPTTAIDAKQQDKEADNILVDLQPPKGVMRYALSDKSFIEKGWTLLPTEMVVRKMNVYRMRPARPEFDWFEHNKHKSQMLYDTGERLAEFDEKGRGRWYYRNGNIALEYYDCEELNAHQRIIIFSSGEPDERGRSRPPMDILATFDYNGNGIVFDHTGKIRLKYNQTEGVVLDKTLGPVSNWKWHSLNDPPVLQQVMIDTQLPHKDPRIMKLGAKNEDAQYPDNKDMLAIEFDNFIKAKSKKMDEATFKPFQIKMKALKINENFSLRVLDQATVYLMFKDGKTNLKLNLGMILDHKEIVDTDLAEVGQVTTCVDKLPARTDSVAALQARVAQAQRAERARAEHSRRLRQPMAPASADLLTAAASRAPRRPLVSGSSAAGEPTYCTRRATTMSVYYQNQLM